MVLRTQAWETCLRWRADPDWWTRDLYLRLPQALF